jgi:hypothetical protein
MGDAVEVWLIDGELRMMKFYADNVPHHRRLIALMKLQRRLVGKPVPHLFPKLS